MNKFFFNFQKMGKYTCPPQNIPWNWFISFREFFFSWWRTLFLKKFWPRAPTPWSDWPCWCWPPKEGFLGNLLAFTALTLFLLLDWETITPPYGTPCIIFLPDSQLVLLLLVITNDSECWWYSSTLICSSSSVLVLQQYSKSSPDPAVSVPVILWLRWCCFFLLVLLLILTRWLLLPSFGLDAHCPIVFTFRPFFKAQ